MDVLVSWDKALFLWLNGMGTEIFDSFWMLLTNRGSNISLYLFLWLLFGYKYSWKAALYLLVFSGLLILCTDQLTNLFKNTVARPRPCFDEEIMSFVRLVKSNCGSRFGFFSGHASNSFALAVFYGLLYKPKAQWLLYLLLIVALFIAYSRIYIGVHYPLDIVAGSVVGSLFGALFFRLWVGFNLRFLS